jgi:gliding motility-associated-like protein
MKTLVSTLFFTLIVFSKVFGNHLVGGDISYKCTGANKFEITLNVYRDGLSGGADFDDPATISIINRDNNQITYRSVNLLRNITLPNNDLGPCANNPPELKLELGVYKTTVTLNTNSRGYSIIYQRCCRNSNIINLSRPDEQGGTLEAFISPKAISECNSQPQFSNYPPSLVCLNQLLVFDHSAIDVDGDSLVYNFCAPFKGLTQTEPIVDPNQGLYATLPPYSNVSYKAPFTFDNPMNTTPKPSIEINSGLLSILPTSQGKFVIGVCVSEYRDGILLSKYIRDIQFTALDCNLTSAQAIVPNSIEGILNGIKVFNYCQGLDVTFENKSTGNFTNFWDFGDLSTGADTSNLKNPTYSYKDTGVYTTTLIINKDKNCSDTSIILVKIFPSINIGFLTNTVCAQTITTFVDTSTTPTSDINGWTWNFGDGGTSIEQNPRHTYFTGGNYPVNLTVTTDKGCKNSYQREISVFYKPKAQTIDEKTCLFANYTYKNLSTIIDGSNLVYDWSIDNVYISNDSTPTVNFTTPGPKNTQLIATSLNGCKDTTNGVITVSDSLVANFVVSSGEICSNKPIEFENTSIGLIENYNWDFGDFTTSTDKNPTHEYLVGSNYPVTLEITSRACGKLSTTKNLTIIQLPLINLPNEITTCFGEYQPISVFDSLGTAIQWSNGATSPTVYADASDEILYVSVNRGDCKSVDSIKINPDCAIYFPTAFSPNNDNVNDLFNIITEKVISFKLSIFNRWGELVYETNDLQNGWNGTFKGKNQPIDVYIYFSEGLLVNGKNFKKSGIFSLFR